MACLGLRLVLVLWRVEVVMADAVMSGDAVVMSRSSMVQYTILHHTTTILLSGTIRYYIRGVGSTMA